MAIEPTWPAEIVVCLRCGKLVTGDPVGCSGGEDEYHGPIQAVEVVPAEQLNEAEARARRWRRRAESAGRSRDEQADLYRDMRVRAEDRLERLEKAERERDESADDSRRDRELIQRLVEAAGAPNALDRLSTALTEAQRVIEGAGS